MECNLNKLNISIVSGSPNTYSLFSTKKPRSIIDGTGSALFNIGSGIVLGTTVFCITPYINIQKNGIYGIMNGLLKGTLGGSLFMISGIFIGSYQLLRGLMNTPYSIYSILNGKRWDNYDMNWVNYNLENEIRKFKEIEQNYISCTKPIDTTYYDLLEIDYQTTTLIDIKKNYYRLAKLKHPDRNINNQSSNKESSDKAFQLLGQAYQTLSNPELRLKYDKYGLQQMNNTTSQIDSNHLFEILFGNDMIKNFVGELYIYTIVTTDNEPDIDFKENKRIIDMCSYMIQLLEPYIYNNKELFNTNITNILEEMELSDIGIELINIIGNTYIDIVGIYQSSIYSNIKEFINVSTIDYNILSSSLHLFQKISNNNNLQTTIDTTFDRTDLEEYDIIDMEQEEKEDLFFNIIDITWYLTILDIQNSIRHMCQNLFIDSSVSEIIIDKRMSGLLILGNAFIGYANNNKINDPLHSFKYRIKQHQ